MEVIVKYRLSPGIISRSLVELPIKERLIKGWRVKGTGRLKWHTWETISDSHFLLVS